jgi:hypothetical protein
MFLVRKPLPALLGAGLIALPHLYGAPQPVVRGSVAPETLAHQFAIAAILASLVFWIALGVLTGVFAERLSARSERDGRLQTDGAPAQHSRKAKEPSRAHPPAGSAQRLHSPSYSTH